MSPSDSRPVVLLTGGSGELGTALIASLQDRWRIAAVRYERPLAGGSQRSIPVDPRHPGRRTRGAVEPPYEIVADLGAEGAIDRIVELTLAKFGTVDVVVNAAGTKASGDLISTRAIDRASAAFALHAVVPVQLAGALADAQWRHDEAGNRAANRSIVNLSALASLDVTSARHNGVFAATKSALNMLTCQLAADLAHLHVRVNAVAPDAFPAQIPTQRVAAGVVRFVEGIETGRILAMWADADELI